MMWHNAKGSRARCPRGQAGFTARSDLLHEASSCCGSAHNRGCEGGRQAGGDKLADGKAEAHFLFPAGGGCIAVIAGALLDR